MKTQGIYKIVNKINNKIYVGQSTNIEQRFKQHKNNSSRNINYPLYNSFRKHGVANFEFIILEKVDNILLLDSIEQYWLDNYKAYNKDFGYNLRTKAKSMRGWKHSEESKKKMSASHKGKVSNKKGKVVSDETRKKMSLASKGKKKKAITEEHRLNLSKAQKGKPKWSEEQKYNMSLSRKGKPSQRKGCILSEEHKRKISIAMLRKKE